MSRGRATSDGGGMSDSGFISNGGGTSSMESELGLTCIYELSYVKSALAAAWLREISVGVDLSRF
jgi:hypothetical protein